MSKKSNKKDNNSKIHTLQTLFHDNITIEINGKVLINESELTINSNTKYFLVGHNGCVKTTLLNYIYAKLKDSVDILLIEQDIKINNGETIYDFILNANKELHDAHTEYEFLAQKEELTDEQKG